jgi:hypothetical protein
MTLSHDNTGVHVPPEIAERFPELIDLILRSESMNVNERQYWVNILPIMTPEQIQNLRDILLNERRQLSAIDEKYENDVQIVGQKIQQEQIAYDRGKKRAHLQQSEQQVDNAETEAEQDILNQINAL